MRNKWFGFFSLLIISAFLTLGCSEEGLEKESQGNETNLEQGETENNNQPSEGEEDNLQDDLLE